MIFTRIEEIFEGLKYQVVNGLGLMDVKGERKEGNKRCGRVLY